MLPFKNSLSFSMKHFVETFLTKFILNSLIITLKYLKSPFNYFSNYDIKKNAVEVRIIPRRTFPIISHTMQQSESRLLFFFQYLQVISHKKPKGASFLALITTNSILCHVSRSTDNSWIICGVRDHNRNKR